MGKYKTLDDVKKRIDDNYHFVKEIECELPKQKNEEDKLRLLSFIGILYSRLVTGIYSSKFLEDEIIKIGREIEFNPKRKPQKNKVLIVMTKGTYSSGHTVVVNNWIKWDEENHYSIVFTDQSYLDVPNFLKDRVRESGGEIICLHGNYISRAKDLLEVSQDYGRVVLQNHMDDLIPVLAYCNPNWNTPVYLYNQADFRFSYGYSISDLVLNMNEFDMEKARIYRGALNNIILQFPGRGDIDQGELKIDKISVKEKMAQKYGFNKNAQLIVSMGIDFKYENIIGVEFDSFVAELLQKHGQEAFFLIIGAYPEREKWKQLEKKTNGKAKALGVLPGEEATELIAVSDLYIVSFPMVAAGARIAMKVGVPYLALLLTERDRMGENGLKTVEELIDKAIYVLDGGAKEYTRQPLEDALTQQEWCEEWHKIMYDYSMHRIQEIKPERCVEKREIINCQLMQENAIDTIRWFIGNLSLGEPIREEIKRLDVKYNLGIAKEDMTIVDYDGANFRDKKYQRLFLASQQWIQLKNEGKRIADYLMNRGYHTIAIYGMDYMGKTLEKELRGSEVEVKYGIDRNAKNIRSDIRLVTPEDELEDVDVIVNTSIASVHMIKNTLKEKYKKDILSIEQILDRMMNDK